ncbi:terpenoid synthase [Suillus ampliporus]|nr:terpenoid synthase [Suillus ampliporus]
MDAHAKVMYLPDTMTSWPWPRAINHHLEDVKAEVDASFRDFKALSHESQEAFNKCNFACLSALIHPNIPREHLRIGCDLMNVYFIVDKYTDVENAAVTKEMVDIGECILGEIVRQIFVQIWAHAIKTASLPSQRHFIEMFTAYVRALVVKAPDREQVRCRTIDDYLKLQRDTCTVRSCVLICEMGMELPDEVFYHPVIVELVDCIVELSLVDNRPGDKNHNLITAIMLELGLDISSAMAWAAHYHAQVQKRFIEGLTKVPLWGPSVDVPVKEFLDSIAMWARGNHSWSFEGQRYFGTRGPEIQQNRLVLVLPKVNCEAAASTVGKVNVADLSKILGTAHRGAT